jgi:GAF domain-containing protein
MPPTTLAATVGHVNAPGTGAGAGHAVDGRVGRDRPGQARLRQLAEEQAALRRVATLAARGEPPEAVFTAVLEEVGRLLPVDLATMCRYAPDRTETFVATWGPAGERFPVGSRWPLEGDSLGALVFDTGRPARLDRYGDSASGPLGAAAREAGSRSAVGAPILVEGDLWGVIFAASTLEQPLPTGTEARLASFTELVATAIANADSRAALARLAEEQAALRRVATMVARGAAPEQVFAAVTDEFARLVPVDVAAMARFEPDDTALYVASWRRAMDFIPIGSRWTLDGRTSPRPYTRPAVRPESRARPVPHGSARCCCSIKSQLRTAGSTATEAHNRSYAQPQTSRTTCRGQPNVVCASSSRPGGRVPARSVAELRRF